ncbi:diguanylate cyclase domain-containing protein [Frankia sp. AgW1.1]|uniref:putative bifunctional diguanylate cyclase/phosphodiesterase n=1 Tax=Frankia sp. AgW1.1 TaxID=1836971 RepID=UPI001933E722|nr:diguanylate cyclase [Frankia sp. AgW1.1]MBL7494243.1 EAL domain-containing protein [Frankia sp. AgW1.1]
MTEKTFRVLAAGTALLALSAALPVMFLDGERLWLAQGAALFVAAVAAAVVGVAAVVRTHGPDRRWRALVGINLIIALVGAAHWNLAGPVYRHTAAVPADLLYILPSVLVLAGLLWIPTRPDGGGASRGPPRDQGRRARYSDALVALDSLVIVASMLLILWIAVLDRIVSSGIHGWPFVTSMTFPLWGTLAVVVVMLVATFRRPRDGRSLALIGSGLALELIPSSETVILNVERVTDLEATAPYWVFMAIGPPMLALGLIAPERRRPAGSPGDSMLTSSWVGRLSWPWPQVYLPYLPLVVTVALILGLAASGVALGGAVLDLALILAMLVAFRQLITVAQNVRLIASVQAAQEQLRHQAFHDLLTGLPNRAHFTRELDQAIADHRSEGRPVGVLFVDLDDFKSVNDTLGHAAGDELLRGVAGRLRAAVRGNDLVARLGGDEFAVLLTDADPTAGPAVTADRIGQRILDAMGPPFTVRGHRRSVRASVGLALADTDQPVDAAEELLHRADSAMYTAKHGSKAILVAYRARTGVAASIGDLSDLSFAARLVGEASPGTLAVCYQPIRCLHGGRLVAIEALLCWTRPSGSPLPAGEILAAAERNGLIGDLDSYLLDRACRELPEVRERLHAPVRLHLNVSPSGIGDDTLVERITEPLRRHHLSADTLVLEIASTARIHDLAAAETTLRQLARTGVAIALDDVGAIDSSLGALHELPITLIKLTTALSTDLLSAEQAPRPTLQAARTALVGFARTIGLTVAADGITTRPQLDALRVAGCELGQGSLLGPPQPLQELGQPELFINGERSGRDPAGPPVLPAL